MKNIFSELPGMSETKWNVTNFHNEHKAAIRSALASGQDFTTGWYSCSKESRSACVTVVAGNAKCEVRAFMDEGDGLVDTAIWESQGKNDNAPSGDDAIQRLDPTLTDSNRQRVNQIIQRMCEVEGDSNEHYEEDECTPTWEHIVACLDRLENRCIEALDEDYQRVVDFAKNHLVGIIADVKENNLGVETDDEFPDGDYPD